MRLHRFLGPFDFTKKKFRILSEAIVSQLRNVLRKKPGSVVLLMDGKLREARAKILRYTDDAVEVELLDVTETYREPEIYTVLYCSILKRENFEIVAQKATEVGVKEIIPVITKRTVKFGLKQKRLEHIIQEAVEQSGRGEVPLFHRPMDLNQAIEHAQSNDKNIFFALAGHSFSVDHLKDAKKIGIFIGPEGGWDEDEITIARKNKFELACLGNLVLRSETAAIIASYLVANRRS